MVTVCPNCGSERYAAFAALPDLPVHVGVLWPDAEQARNATRGPIELCACPDCGFVGNGAFDADRVDYALRYDNALHHSPRFRRYEEELAERLVGAGDARGGRVVEIGCGGGHFLRLLAAQGGHRGVGFDPSFHADPADPLPPEVEIHAVPYGPEQARQRADLLCCRHVLEHIPEPREFLAMIRRSLGEEGGTRIYFEVPNADFIFDDLSVWDVIYEHCNYFTATSLRAVFEASGFEVLSCESSFEGQFLALEALPRPGARLEPTAAELQASTAQTEAFGRALADKREGWAGRLRQAEGEGKRVAVWGGGAKAVSFLNLVEGTAAVSYVVDVNPAKQGHFIGGSGHPIVGPERVEQEPPDLVVLMNPIYREEVAAELTARGARADLAAV